MQDWLRDVVIFTRNKPFFVVASFLIALSSITSAFVGYRINVESRQRAVEDCDHDKALSRGMRNFGEVIIAVSTGEAEEGQPTDPPDPRKIEAFRELLAATFPDPDC